MPYARRSRKRAAPRKKKSVKFNGNKIKLSKGEGLSKQEFSQIKKMLPRVETKMGPVGIFAVQSVPYQVSGDLPNIPIIGQTTTTSLGFTTGVDFIRQGTGDGERVGSRIAIKKLSTHLQWCVDESKTDAGIDPGPYQVRWLIYKVKNTYSAMGDGGLPQAQNSNWKTMYNDGNEIYTEPLGNVTDMYRQINKDFYTVHKQGLFVLQTVQRKIEPQGDYVTQPMVKSNSGAFHHIYLDLTRFCAKTLKYIDDPNAPVNQNCTNDSMYLTYTVCRYDNQPIQGNLVLNCTMINTLLFSDS